MKIYNDNIEIECNDIMPRKSGKITYYYANNKKINDTMKIDFICLCGKAITTNVKAYKKDPRNLCKSCKTKQTNLIKYGEINLLHSEKARKTNLEKYGKENYSKTEEARKRISLKNKKNKEKALEKRRETNIKKYGVEYSFQAQEVKNKIKETNIKKYNGHPMDDHDVKNKVIQRHYFKYYQRLLRRKDIKPLFEIKDYSGISESIEYEWECLKCKNQFTSKIYTGYIKKCPVCYPNQSGKSNIEKEISNFIRSFNITVVENTKSIIHPYELDIYLPDYKIGIELNGLYWHSELNGKDKNYHLNKTILCNNRGIELIHLFEDEWIVKQDIVENIIKTKLGIIDNKIFARKCVVKKIENQKKFLETYHIQGYIPSKINLGLFYNQELISLLTFGKPRFNKDYDWEILRYVNKAGCSIVGGFSKMLAFFRKNYKGSIITYSDMRLFNGRVYELAGFTKVGNSKPNYYYTDYKQYRVNRQKFQKHKLKNLLESYDPNLTEWENMQMNGWDRIYDCGNHIFTLK